ncbi:transcription antitermination factor NusB [Prochlorococcus sp. MIT 1223]|uniref:transcription antitermination factor NusB n=1 Tax=Prochlorococcus sp. MIT 1223 TaxID=3096217 RepID=UPI002A75E232|nr:transcription antitermination factor NusB [Prochlorococcus sp. MIT 1223]
MQSRSVSRELALLLLGQMEENQIKVNKNFSIEQVLNKALDTLTNHWKEELADCANLLEIAYEELNDSELKEFDKSSNQIVRKHLTNSLKKGELILNSLEETIDLTRLISLSDHEEIRFGAINRVNLILNKFSHIDQNIDNVMEGWRLKRLPRIDRDILRIAFVDLNNLNIPVAVACNEAVNLANRYSDEQGRKMINGILRKLQDNMSLNLK